MDATSETLSDDATATLEYLGLLGGFSVHMALRCSAVLEMLGLLVKRGGVWLGRVGSARTIGEAIDAYRRQVRETAKSTGKTPLQVAQLMRRNARAKTQAREKSGEGS